MFLIINLFTFTHHNISIGGLQPTDKNTPHPLRGVSAPGTTTIQLKILKQKDTFN
jgi:hypothetical protein